MPAKKKAPKSKSEAKQKNPYSRDQLGLLKNIEYKHNLDGSIDWRSMIPNEFLYVRSEWFTRKGLDVPKSPEGLQDNQLAIMLGGIKYLAKIRGFSKVLFDISHVRKDYISCKCTIHWNHNFESIVSSEFPQKEDVVYQEYANATSENTNSFCLKFLETIACNRAFVRCVRNFLNIHIVGVDELDNSSGVPQFETLDNEDPNASLSPQSQLDQTVADKFAVDFDEFKSTKLREFWENNSYRNNNTADWKSFSDIPAKDARQILNLIKKS